MDRLVPLTMYDDHCFHSIKVEDNSSTSPVDGVYCFDWFYAFHGSVISPVVGFGFEATCDATPSIGSGTLLPTLRHSCTCLP